MECSLASLNGAGWWWRQEGLKKPAHLQSEQRRTPQAFSTAYSLRGRTLEPGRIWVLNPRKFINYLVLGKVTYTLGLSSFMWKRLKAKPGFKLQPASLYSGEQWRGSRAGKTWRTEGLQTWQLCPEIVCSVCVCRCWGGGYSL